MADLELLSPRTAPSYLAARGVVADPERVRVVPLGGGVSNVVLAITDGARSFVLKQALPRLRVAEEWTAPPERVLSEAAALELVGRHTPGHVPTVLHIDAERLVMLIEHAPAGWQDWKQLLLAGSADPDIAHRLGAALARWQNTTAGGAGLHHRFTDPEPFERLRVDPYHRTTMRRLPEHAARIDRYVKEMASRRHVLVHGDYSPKNILTGPAPQADGPASPEAEVGEGPPTGLWVIDWEVAHLGDPAFDVAFLLSHLLLKAVHRPRTVDAYQACATAFVEAYETTADAPADRGYIAGHAGCLLLARVAGKSPAEYLTEPQRQTTLALGARLLTAPDAQWSNLV